MQKEFNEISDELKEVLKEFIDKANGMLGDLTILEEKYKELESEKDNLDSNNNRLKDEKRKLENELDELKEQTGEPTDTLKEIIEKAESWNYGIKGYRTLETKQDLIDAIKKEVL